jgi:3,4-dihydroxy 2-butanone 4-phosphate synthase/GTP cyclohydrolase II
MLTAAVAALNRGEMIAVEDDRDRTNDGDFVMAAARITDQQMAYRLRHGSEIVCVPTTEQRADALDLPLMTARNSDPNRTAFTISAGHVATGTGISAADRALTVRTLAGSAKTARDLRRRGMCFRCAPMPAGCWRGRASPRRRSTCLS